MPQTLYAHGLLGPTCSQSYFLIDQNALAILPLSTHKHMGPTYISSLTSPSLLNSSHRALSHLCLMPPPSQAALLAYVVSRRRPWSPSLERATLEPSALCVDLAVVDDDYCEGRGRTY